MTDSKTPEWATDKAIESVNYSSVSLLSPDEFDAVIRNISQALLSAYERGRAEHVDLIDKLDSALCQFLNNAADEYDPRVWVPSVKRDFAELDKVYNECHVAGLMDIQRAARTIRQLLEVKG